MFVIEGTTIILTRGDSFYATVRVIDKGTGQPYEFQQGDSLKFGLKKSTCEPNCLIEKDISTSKLELALSPSDTKTLPFGTYVYDIQLTFANGDVDTFINEAKFILKDEVL